MVRTDRSRSSSSVESRRIAVLLALSLGLASPAWANVGVPLLAVFWPIMWLLLAIIIPLEAWVAKRVLGADWPGSLDISIHANLVSTALGIPALWVLPSLGGIQDIALGGIARGWGVPVSDGHHTWLALAAAAMLGVPSFLVSVVSEYLAVRRAVEPPKRRRLWHWAWTANALSYVLVFALSASYFQYVIPSWYGKVWQAACRSNLHVIALSVQDYRQEHQGRMPAVEDFTGLVAAIRPAMARHIRSSTSEERLLRCPATGKEYVFNTALSGVSGSSLLRPAEVPLLRDAVPHSRYGYCVAFVDGHVSSLRVGEPRVMDKTFR